MSLRLEEQVVSTKRLRIYRGFGNYADDCTKLASICQDPRLYFYMLGREATMSGTQQVTSESIWEQLQVQLLAFIRRRVPDDATAEDLLQDVFLRIEERLGQLSDQERVAAWVYRIARNRVADYHRGARPSVPLSEEPEAEPAEEEQVGNKLVGAWLMAMVNELPEPYREAIHLVEIEGMSQTQVAERLGISVSGAKSRVQRGRAKLREMLHRCCEVERDRRGNVIDIESRDSCC